MREAQRSGYSNSERGVALILVMLCIVVLSVLAASIVFSARSETFASYNYRTSLQADYVAKAGLQKAINYFNSSKYVPVPPDDATTRYGVAAYQTTPLTLYTATARPVICISGCASNNQPVTLSMSGSTFSGNYPTYLTNADGETIPTSYASHLASGTLNPLAASNNSGQFTVTAILESYRTVNDAFYPAINRKPYEVWYVTSTGTWTSKPPSGGVPATPTSVQEATLAPVYLPYFANALYGMCNITMSGNVCTDSYNSNSGAYNGSNPANCVTAGTAGSNAFASGAGIGSGGNVTLNGGSYVVNGDVSYGATAPTYSSLWACASASSGVTGNVSGVKGTVQPVPAIPEPPMPTFPACSWYGGGGTSCNKVPASFPTPSDPANLGNGDYVWVKQTSGIWYYEHKSGGTTTDYQMTFANWSASTPYSVGAIVAPGNGHAYRVTAAGLSGTSAPSWPTGTGSTVTDGSTPPNWAPNTAYAVGAVVQPSPANGHAYKAITAGTSSATQPSFPTGSGATVTDSTYATWTPGTPYASGVTILAGGYLYQSQNAGISGHTAPAWNTTVGSNTTDNNYAAGGWSNGRAYTVGEVMIGTGGKSNAYVYRCTVAGTTSSPQPTWTTTIGNTQTNGSATFQNIGLQAAITWLNLGAAGALTWQEIGPNTPVTWTENGSVTNIFGAGTQDDPFRLPALSSGNNSYICLTGGATATDAIHYDIKSVYAHGAMYIVNASNPPASCPPPGGYSDTGYAVVNIYETLSMGGQGVVQPATAKATALVINVYNSGSNTGDSVTLTGQANLKAMVTALGDAKLGGGGSGGAFYGSMLAGSITDMGTYSVHYDQALQVISGKMMPMAIRNYNRPKY